MTATTHERHLSFSSGIPAVPPLPGPHPLKPGSADSSQDSQRLADLLHSLHTQPASNFPYVLSGDGPASISQLGSSPIATAAILSAGNSRSQLLPTDFAGPQGSVQRGSSGGQVAGTRLPGDSGSVLPRVTHPMLQLSGLPQAHNGAAVGSIQAAARALSASAQAPPDLFSYMMQGPQATQGPHAPVPSIAVAASALNSRQSMGQYGAGTQQGHIHETHAVTGPMQGAYTALNGNHGAHLASVPGDGVHAGHVSSVHAAQLGSAQPGSAQPAQPGSFHAAPSQRDHALEGTQRLGRLVKNVSWCTPHTVAVYKAAIARVMSQPQLAVGWDGVGPAAQAAADDAAAAALQQDRALSMEQHNQQTNHQQPPHRQPQSGDQVPAQHHAGSTARPHAGGSASLQPAAAAAAQAGPTAAAAAAGYTNHTSAGPVSLLDYMLPGTDQGPGSVCVGLDTQRSLDAMQQSLPISMPLDFQGALWVSQHPRPQQQWLQDYLDMLGQEGDDKHVFVALRRLPLPAVSLLSSFLTYAPRVRAITLVHTGLDDHGAYELSMGLRNSFGDLWSLDLRHNRIASKGAIALAGCLPVCPALREVVLNHNKIGDEGVLALSDALSATGMAVRIRVAHNPCGSDAVKELTLTYKQSKQRRARTHKSILQQLERLTNSVGGPETSSPKECIFDHALTKGESIEDPSPMQHQQQTMQNEDSPTIHSLSARDRSGDAAAPAAGAARPGLLDSVSERLRAMSAALIGNGGAASGVVGSLGPTTTAAAAMGPPTAHKAAAALARRSIGPIPYTSGGGGGNSGMSPYVSGPLQGVMRQPLSVPLQSHSLKSCLNGPDDLEQLCALLRLLFSPTLPEEHSIAQDVGAALLDLSCHSKSHIRSLNSGSLSGLTSLTDNGTLKGGLGMGMGIGAPTSGDGPTVSVGSLIRGTMHAFAEDHASAMQGLHGSAAGSLVRGSMQPSAPRMAHGDAGEIMQRLDGGGRDAGQGLHGDGGQGAAAAGSVIVHSGDDDSEASAMSDLSRLLSAMTTKGHAASVTTSIGGNGADCLQNLRHSYITIQVPLRSPDTDSPPTSFDGPKTCTSQRSLDMYTSDSVSVSGYSVKVDDLYTTSRPLTRNVSVNSLHGIATGAAAPAGAESLSTRFSKQAGAQGASPRLGRDSVQDPFVFDSSTHSNKGYAQWVAARDDSGHNGRAYAIWAGIKDDGSTHGGGMALAQIAEQDPAPDAAAQAPAGAPLPIRRNVSGRQLTRSALSGSLRGAGGGGGGGSPPRQETPAVGTPTAAGASPPQRTPPPTHARIIVDPGFKEQFEIGRQSTERYDLILAALPRVYVGQEERLSLLVELLCEEMGLAFKERGLPLPPWRRASSLMSKWKARTTTA